jgi:hypothetical protein
LAEVIKRCPSDSQVVGYYRTGLDHQIRLRQADLDCIAQSFQDPLDVFLVVAAKDGGRLAGGFFVRQNGSVASDPYLVFPFSAAELATGKWPVRDGDRLGEGALASIVSLFNRTSPLSKAAIGAAVIALAITFFITEKKSPASVSRAPSPAKLGLRVERDTVNFLIAWDPSAPEIGGAKAGTILISDGSSPPTIVAMAPDQLRKGTLTYSSPSLGDKVEFQLDLLELSGPERTESIISVSGRPGPDLADQLKPPTTPQPNAPKSVIRSVAGAPAPNAIARKVGSTVAKRSFIPPRRGVPLAGGPMPEPPTITTDIQDSSGSQLLNNIADAAAKRPAPQNPVPAESGSGVTITSEPSGAKVEINGTLAGYTPITIKVTPLGLGFTVAVTKDGFAKWMAQTFSTAEPSGLHAQLRQLPRQPVQ